MRVVLDTNTVVSALLWRGAPHQVIAQSQHRAVVFFTSPRLLVELDEVLRRPKLARAVRASGLDPGELRDRYRRLAQTIPPEPLPKTILDDPDDDEVLACAVTARADLIVSGDKHLLRLRGFRGIPIITAADCVRRLEFI
jgi:putative PIN family toxin of toxin-antitoxin system